MGLPGKAAGGCRGALWAEPSAAPCRSTAPLLWRGPATTEPWATLGKGSGICDNSPASRGKAVWNQLEEGRHSVGGTRPCDELRPPIGPRLRAVPERSARPPGAGRAGRMLNVPPQAFPAPGSQQRAAAGGRTKVGPAQPLGVGAFSQLALRPSRRGPAGLAAIRGRPGSGLGRGCVVTL